MLKFHFIMLLEQLHTLCLCEEMTMLSEVGEGRM